MVSCATFHVIFNCCLLVHQLVWFVVLILGPLMCVPLLFSLLVSILSIVILGDLGLLVGFLRGGGQGGLYINRVGGLDDW